MCGDSVQEYHFKMKEPCNVSSDKESTNKTNNNSLSFDDILYEIGEFGRYQILAGILMGIAFLLTTSTLFNFVFSSEIPDHRYCFCCCYKTVSRPNWTNLTFEIAIPFSLVSRCLIPECEQSNSNNFDAEWTTHAIPYENGRPKSCARFQYIPTPSSHLNDGMCNESNFNRSHEIHCDSIFVRNNEERLVTRVRDFFCCSTKSMEWRK